MKSIIRKDSGKGWKDYTKQLAKKARLDDPTDAELRQFDKKRPGKKVSDDEWENPNDSDARITRMKNRTTRMAYKADHAVDLESDLIVSATVHPGNAADTATVIDTAIDAAVNLQEAGCENEVERSFAHVCDTGGARRTWLRGLQSVTKRHLMVAAARNLSTIMRVICGIGSPRALQGLRALLQLAWTHFGRLISALENVLDRSVAYGAATVRPTSAA